MTAMSATSEPIAKPRKRFRVSMRQHEALAALAFLAPGLLMFLAFTLGPALFSFAVGFTRWDGLSSPVWSGIDNYIRLAQDPLFLKSIVNTAWFTLLLS